MLLSDPCTAAKVMSVIEEVACEASSMNAIQKHYFIRAVLASAPPIKLLALVSAAVHVPKVMQSAIRCFPP